VDETDSPEQWEEHEAYCQYVSATLAWFESGCCDTEELEVDVPCDDPLEDTEELAEVSCPER
jgi:hypothetical protein